MKVRLLLVIAVSLVLGGCAVNLPFNNRLAYSAVREAKSFAPASKGPIALRWMPAEFQDRIDFQGASGFVGGGSETRIPIGPALTNRITEVLDTAIGISDSSPKLLTITVIKAQSEFEYSAGFFNVTPAIDVGKCIFEAEFSLADKRWKESFQSEARDPEIGGTSQTGTLEKVWDEIALKVGRNVVQHL